MVQIIFEGWQNLMTDLEKDRVNTVHIIRLQSLNQTFFLAARKTTWMAVSTLITIAQWL
jgi:hypothetical protein